jgi:signal transduction histidine kinase/AmiR/NasT family two-component response regulator
VAAPRKNTLSLRIAVGAALLAAFVAVVFVSLIGATTEARRADRAARAGGALISSASRARQQVSAVRTSDASAVRRAAGAAVAAAGFADDSALGTTAGNEIRRGAVAYRLDPRRGRAVLVRSLDSVITRQQEDSARRSTELSDALTRSLILGVIGLVGSVVSIVLFGTDMLRSVTLPMRRLAAAARRLGSGDLSTRVPETGIADLQGLAKSLNNMAVSLEATRKALDGQHSQLATSREEADRANHAKSEFLSRMSHELRTPLNAILCFAQLLELDELDPRQRDNVAHIVSGGKHLLDLINEVLEISRIEVGTLSPAIEPVHVATMVQDAIELVRPLASQRRIAMTTDADAHRSVWIAADQQRLKQVLLNLLANAVKYNREGGSFMVRIKELGGRARILVTDTGLGIPQDQLPRLFTPFERLGAEASGVEGTGLGLVLALRLTEAMEGSLGIESQPWIGSTFHVELPLAEAPERPAAEPPARRLAAVGPEGASRGGARRVLYIEDDAANTRLMAQLFADDSRLELMTTMHGRLGIELARQHRPDLILLDIHLPDLDGDEILKRLRDDEVTRGIPVIAVSADASEDQRTRMTALGAARYLTKPLALSMVLSTIWEELDANAKVHALRRPEAQTA